MTPAGAAAPGPARPARPARRPWGRSRRAILPALVATACGAPAPPPPAPAPAPTSLPRIAVRVDSAATAVVAAVVVPGSAWEDAGTTGLTLLSARTLLAGIRPRLDSLGAAATVRCERAAFAFSLVTPPGSWQPALDLFLDALFRPDADPEAFEDARHDLAAALRLDQANPAWQARLAARHALFGDAGDAGAWARPACGVPETLPLFDVHDAIAAAMRFRPERATIALIGPLDPRTADVLARRFPELAAPAVPLPGPPPVTPAHRYVERNTVTAWVSLAFRFPVGTDAETVRLIGALLADVVSPSLDRPGLFASSVEVEEDGGGGVLVVHSVAEPRAAADVARRIEDAALSLAAEGPAPDRLGRVLDRHRGARLRELALPESRATWLALGLARGRPRSGGWPGESAWTAGAVRAAAGSFGGVARSVVGPRAAREAALP